VKLATIVVNGTDRVAVRVGEKVGDLALAYENLLVERGEPIAHTIAAARIPPSMKEFIAAGEPSLRAAKEAHEYLQKHPNAQGQRGEKIIYGMSEVKFRPALPNPERLMHIGVNTKPVLKMFGAPDRPMMFLKNPRSVIGDGDDIVLMPEGESYLTTSEIELAVVIGKKGRNIPPSEAYDHIFGYVCINDVTAQEKWVVYDFGDKSFGEHVTGEKLPTDPPTVGGHHVITTEIEQKNYDTWFVMNSFIVTKDDIKDPHKLQYTAKINGKVVQNGSSEGLVLRIPQAVSAYSRMTELVPGDLIPMGTVGIPKESILHAGDVLESQVEGLGSMKNNVVAWEKVWHDYPKWDDLMSEWNKALGISPKKPKTD
jgi:acylpyruvate hydrolase